ncbi:MAG: hypothetical protein N2115_06340 [bacterium]|nr:hypothetical protein [bacterium]
MKQKSCSQYEKSKFRNKNHSKTISITGTTNNITRIRPDFPQEVKIPAQFRRYLWEHTETAPLEKIITRAFTYGDFEEIKKIYMLYPEESYRIVKKYQEIKRGVGY